MYITAIINNEIANILKLNINLLYNKTDMEIEEADNESILS